jgi:anti-anti-sigma factor
MNIEERATDGATVVRLSGRLDTGTAPRVQERLDTVVDGGADLVVVDLGGVDFMSSAGLRVLLATAKRLRPRGSLRLFGLNPTVRDVFEMSGFSMILAVFEDEATALAG